VAICIVAKKKLPQVKLPQACGKHAFKKEKLPHYTSIEEIIGRTGIIQS
jgi:hypothetical protein